MPGRVRFVLVSSLLAGAALGQQPQRPTGQIPQPASPQPLPPNIVPAGTPVTPSSGEIAFPAPDPSVRIPLRERFTPIDFASLYLRPQNDNWTLYAGNMPLREFGRSQTDADEARRVIRELRPTVWCDIPPRADNSPDRPVVGYGLVGGKVPATVPTPKRSAPIDLASVRAEAVRGAWCLRDDGSVHLNFGRSKPDAEQAAAVCRKYGFNRLGLIGHPEPTFAFFYAAPLDTNGLAPAAASALVRAAQEQALTRTGIPVPGLGFVGERIVIDARQLEVRKDRADYVLAHGPDVLAKFGINEWVAQDALRTVRDNRFTEFCRVGELTFFLAGGKPPTRVPFSAQGLRFTPGSLKVQPADGRWGVYDSGRLIVPAASKEEGEQVVRVIQAFGFDQVCRVGSHARASLLFLAKTSAR